MSCEILMRWMMEIQAYRPNLRARYAEAACIRRITKGFMDTNTESKT